MYCVPPGYPSELCAIDPLIKCLEVLEGRKYRLVEMLDEKIRSSAQPEALYVNDLEDSRLVIERKSIVYPENYVQSHKYDHYIMDTLFSNLPKKISEGPYILEFGYLYEGRFDDIKRHANSIVQKLCEQSFALSKDGFIRFEVDGCDYLLRTKTPADHDDMTSWNNLVIQFGHNLPRYNSLKPPFGEYLNSLIRRIFDAVKKKCESYKNHRRILLINRYGDARRTRSRDWKIFFQDFPDEIPVDEIWDSWIETPDYSEESFWIHDRFYPCIDPDVNVADDIWIPCRCYKP